jgi:hypothetical protein
MGTCGDYSNNGNWLLFTLGCGGLVGADFGDLYIYF